VGVGTQTYCCGQFRALVKFLVVWTDSCYLSGLQVQVQLSAILVRVANEVRRGVTFVEKVRPLNHSRLRESIFIARDQHVLFYRCAIVQVIP
jgi:hypothetical protein